MAKMNGHHGMSLFELVRKYNECEIVCPSWQRGLVWDEHKQEAWFSILNNVDDKIKKYNTTSLDVPGVIILHKIKTSNAPVLFINDGGNRLLATVKYANMLKENGFKEEEIQKRLSKVRITYQEWEYEDNKDAFGSFIELNKGTVPTTYELSKGLCAVKLDNYESIWKTNLEGIFSIVLQGLQRLNCKRRDRRGDEHKDNRDSLSLYYRFISENNTTCNFRAGSTIGKSLDIDKLFENKLVTLLIERSYNTFEKIDIPKFKKFISEEIAFIQDIWNDNKSCPHSSTVRWLLHLACYRRYNNIPTPVYKDWVAKLLKYTSGKSSVFPLDKDRKEKNHKNLGLSNLAVLKGVCDILEDNSILAIQKRIKVKGGKIISPGYDESHINAFSLHGNGPTIIEPSLDNKSRGKLPIIQSK